MTQQLVYGEIGFEGTGYAVMPLPQPKFGMWEYLLVANPDEAINEMVKAEKELFYKQFGEKIAVKTKPHITVANFMAMENMEHTVINWLQRICGQQRSFSVMLNNYSGFPTGAIYLRVQNPKPFQYLAKQLKVINDYVLSYDCPAAHIVKTPHMTIARKLSADVYEKAMYDYAAKDFNGSFMVTKLILLRRRNQLDACKQVGVFSFLPETSTLFDMA